MINFKGTLLVVVSFVIFAGCGQDEQERKAEQIAEGMQKTEEEISDRMKEGFDDLSKSMKKMGDKIVDTDVETVDYQKLKNLLPDDFAKMKRKKAFGEKTKAFGITVAKAEGQYESDDRASLRIEITDMGSLKGVTAMASLPWLLSDFERESENGYERTMTYKGEKGFEKYNHQNQQGEIQLVIARRFVVSINGYHVSDKVLKKALNKVAVKKLAKMAK